MFKEERKEPQFDWSMIGDIAVGRPNLGDTMNVSVYRLMQFTMRDVMIAELGVTKTDRLFYQAGEKAGQEFSRQLLDKDLDLDSFFQQLQDLLATLKIGILRIEAADLDDMRFVLTISEDLDCSGLPVSDETICTYDEGFIAGILMEFTGSFFAVKEVDCWCSGDRVCRFEAKQVA